MLTGTRRRRGEFDISVSAVLAEWRGQTVILAIGSDPSDGPDE